MTRRSLLSMLAAVPFVGKVLRPAPKVDYTLVRSDVLMGGLEWREWRLWNGERWYRSRDGAWVKRG